MKKAKNTVEGALEAEEKEVEQIRSLLQKDLFIKIQRRKTLVNNLFDDQDTESSTDSENIKQQIYIGNLYGQAVFGNNYGKLNQNVPKEFLETLEKLFKLVVENEKVPDDIKSDALGDIQTIQAQSLKSNPSKTLMQKALQSLSVLADGTQVGGVFAKHVLPHMDKIQQFISNLS